MWNKPWGYAEGYSICGGFVCAGLMLQLTAGPINWTLIAFPINIILLVGILLIIGAMHAMRRRSYAMRWCSSTKAAVPALAVAAALTVIMGLTPQVAATAEASDPIGLSKMLSCWPFVLIYTWLEIVLGMTCLRQISQIFSPHNHTTAKSRNRIPVSIVSHLGLFIALLCGTLGNGDMQRLKMTTQKNGLEWRAVDDLGQMHELDLAIKLHDFSIDMYPAKLIIVDKATGKSLPEDNPDIMLLEEGVREGDIDGWHIVIDEFFDKAASTGAADSLRFMAWPSMGGCCALKATATKGNLTRTGWVSCGSFMFQYAALSLEGNLSLVMPEREPRRYASAVTVYTEQGEQRSDTITVNHPMDINGWKIYQLSYDDSMGEWSQTSVFELVSDPWLPYVYAGIALMLLGAVLMFFRKKQ